MNDLIYGGDDYKKELSEIFPSAVFEDASDDIHRDRISLEVDIEQDEYLRLIAFNGFVNMSLCAQLFFMDKDNKNKIKSLIDNWKRDYPEYFRQRYYDH